MTPVGNQFSTVPDTPCRPLPVECRIHLVSDNNSDGSQHLSESIFQLTLSALPDRLPPEHRLRSLLKALKRYWGFQCVRCSPCLDESQVCVCPPAPLTSPSSTPTASLAGFTAILVAVVTTLPPALSVQTCADRAPRLGDLAGTPTNTQLSGGLNTRNPAFPAPVGVLKRWAPFSESFRPHPQGGNASQAVRAHYCPKTHFEHPSVWAKPDAFNGVKASRGACLGPYREHLVSGVRNFLGENFRTQV
jgi:hypothetical protein